MATKIKKISDLKPSPYNPRLIKDDALRGLGCSIQEFGDLSGITFNSRSGNLVSGHMRVKSLISTYGDLDIKRDKIVIPGTDKKFKIRIVDWSKGKEKAANIAANNENISGDWTQDLLPILEDIEINSPELFLELNLSPLKLDIDTNPPTKEEKGNDGEGIQEEWVKFAVGGKVGVVHRDVYLLFCSEWDRLSGIVESEEITPIIEAMVANSAVTPEESLK